MSPFASNYFGDYLLNTFYSFSRPMYERTGWYATESEGNTYILVNTLGVAEKDIDVSVDASENPNKHVLSVKGRTHNDLIDKDFSIDMRWITNPVKEVHASFADGIMTLKLEFESPVKPSVKIVRK